MNNINVESTLDRILEVWEERSWSRLGQLIISSTYGDDKSNERLLEGLATDPGIPNTDNDINGTIHRLSLLSHRLKRTIPLLARQYNIDNIYDVFMLTSRDTVELFYIFDEDLVSRLEKLVR